MAVLVVLAVRLVVALVVADEVVQREPVMGADEVHRGPGLASGGSENLARAGHRARQRRQLAGIAAPVGADGVAELVVPLAPAGREAADLITAAADIPGFGDELHLGQHRILTDGPQKAGLLREVMRVAGQRRSKIEAEPVDVVRLDPMAQRVEHHLKDARMAEVERVSGARRIPGEARVLGRSL